MNTPHQNTEGFPIKGAVVGGPDLKRCTLCKQEKTKDEFYTDLVKHLARCKECTRNKAIRYYYDNRKTPKRDIRACIHSDLQAESNKRLGEVNE